MTMCAVQNYVYLERDNNEWLWDLLNRRELKWCDFVRDLSIGPHTVEFVSLKRRIAIELDHCSPEYHLNYDYAKVGHLLSAGFRVLRIWSQDITNHPEQVVELITDQVGREQRKPSGMRPANLLRRWP